MITKAIPTKCLRARHDGQYDNKGHTNDGQYDNKGHTNDGQYDNKGHTNKVFEQGMMVNMITKAIPMMVNTITKAIPTKCLSEA